MNDSADFSLLLFVLSAISPDKYHSVIKKLSEQMKRNGVVFFRDYGRYDMAQLRFSKRGN
jgi:methyltransferase-like protein 6